MFATRPDVEEVLQLFTMALAIRERVPTVAEVFIDATDKARFAQARLRRLGTVVDDRPQ